jgi:hypothetical protein
MLRPSAIRLRERTLRLIAERKVRAAEESIRNEKLKETRNREFATLIGNYLISVLITFLLCSSSFFLIRPYWTDF